MHKGETKAKQNEQHNVQQSYEIVESKHQSIEILSETYDSDILFAGRYHKYQILGAGAFG